MKADVVRLQQTSWQTIFANPESALLLAKESYDLAKKWGHDTLVPYSLRLIGMCEMYCGRFQIAGDFLEQSIDRALAIGDFAAVSRSYNNLGRTYFDMGQFSVAVQYYETALSLAVHSSDHSVVFALRCNLIRLYETLEDRVACDKLIDQLAGQDFDLVPEGILCVYYYVKVEQCLARDQLEQFDHFFERAHALAQTGQYKRMLFSLQTIRAHKRYLQGDVQPAIQQLEDIVVSSEFHVQGIERYRLLQLLAQWYFSQGNSTGVSHCLDRALALESVSWPHQILQNLHALVSACFEKEGDFKQALYFANEAYRLSRELKLRQREAVHSSRAKATQALHQETARVQKLLELQALEMLHEQTLHINKIGRSLASTLDFSEMGIRLFEALSPVMPVTTISLVEMVPESPTLEVVLVVENGEVNSDGIGIFSANKTYANKVVNSQKIEICNDFKPESVTLIKGTRVIPRSALFLPLMLGDRVLGVWSVQSENAGAYESGHIDLVEAVAPFVAIAFNNALTHLHNIELIGDLHDEKVAVEVAHKKVTHQALHDALTELPNRIALSRTFLDSVTAAAHHESTFHIIFLDLNGFKQVNDAHGHSVGDAVIRAMGQRLKTFFRESDFVCRLGGDEFVAVVPGFPDGRKTDIFVDRIRANISRDICVNGLTFSLGVSVGVATYPQDGASLDELLVRADKLMYRDKMKNRA